MSQKKWTEESAVDFIFRNSTALKTKLGLYFVKNGTAGNGVLGAIDYLRNYKRYPISIVSEEQFENL